MPDADAQPPHPEPNLPTSPSEVLAPPLARLAAVIVDLFVVLAPAYLICSAPVKHAMTVNVFVGASAPEFYSLVILGIALVLGVAYQTLMHAYFSATFGKRLFGLEVVSVAGPVGLGAHLVRSIGWIFSAALLGLPFLAVWSHARRRPPHDRLAETIVVTRRGGIGAPPAFARDLVRAAYALVALTLGLAVVGALADLKSRARDDERSLAAEGGCEAVSRALGDEDDGEHARVRLSLTLFAAGLADRACMEAEVERELSLGVKMAPPSYLAQAFVNADDAEVSNAYLDRVCAEAPASAECSLSEIVSNWAGDDVDGVESELARAPAGSGYLEVWGVRHFMAEAKFGRALAALDRLIDRPEIADFTLVERVRALYGDARWDEARAAYAQAATVLPLETGRELSAWACVRELARGCEASTQGACARLDAAPADEVATSAATLARLRLRECRPETAVDYLELAADSPDEDWADFYRASAGLGLKNPARAVALFQRVLDSDSADELLRDEAQRRLDSISAEPARRPAAAEHE